jgi:hypothetical protein
MGEDDLLDIKSGEVMRTVMSHEPETALVVFGGDQVGGSELQESHSGMAKWIQSLTTVGSTQVPFATIFGNHDDQVTTFLSPQWHPWTGALLVLHVPLVAILVGLHVARGVPRRVVSAAGIFLCISGLILVCMFLLGYQSARMRRAILHYEQAHFEVSSQSQAGSPDLPGVSNYVLRVSCHNTSSRRPFLIFLMDTGGGRIDYGFTGAQMEWVQSVSAQYPGSHAILFAHLPSVEFERALTAGESVFRCVGDEETEPSAVTEWPPMESLAKAGIQALFVGHDHRNSYCCMPNRTRITTPTLCYGRHTGYGGYGDWARGARVIRYTFGKHGSLETWLRMENGSVASPITILLHQQ